MRINEIYRADCLEFMKRMPDNSVNLIIADPPYEIDIKGGGLSTKTSIFNGKLDKISTGFDIDAVFEEFGRICKPLNLFCFCANRQIARVMGWAQANGYSATLLIWHKTNAVPFCKNVWRSDVEFCAHIRGKNSLCEGGYRIKSKVFTHKICPSKSHPTAKPLDLVKKYILVGSKPNDLVFDPFMGSGTTTVACKELGRNFIGCEIEQDYVNAAKERIELAQKEPDLCII